MSEASIVESIRNIMRGLVRLALRLLLHLSTATCFGPMLPTAAHQPATQAIEPPVCLLAAQIKCPHCLKQGVYYEARAVDIDPASRTITCIREFCEVRGCRAGTVVQVLALRYQAPGMLARGCRCMGCMRHRMRLSATPVPSAPRC